MRKSLVFGHKPKEEVVRRALEEARQALGEGALPARVLPTPEGEVREWTPGMVRAGALLSAHLWGVLELGETPVDLALLDRVVELREELGLGPWVRELPRVRALLVPGAEEVPARVAGERVALGERVATSLHGEDWYHLQVAYWAHRARAYREVRERVQALVQAHPRAKVGPEDFRTIMGRLRAGKRVWVRATPEELEGVVERAAKALTKAEKAYISPEWRWRGEGPHPRVRLARERVRALLEEASAENGEPQKRGGLFSPHFSPLRPHEEILLGLLGRDVEGLDEGDVARVLGDLREEVARLPSPKVPLPLGEEDLKVLEEAGLEVERGGGVPTAPKAQTLALLRQAERRLLAPRALLGTVVGLRQALAAIRLLPQPEVRRLLTGGAEDRKRVALEAALGALEVLLGREELWEEALGLAYELGLEAVEEMRSPYYHPAGYAARKARDRLAYYLELRRGVGVGLDPYTATGLFRLRELLRREPGLGPEEAARRLEVPEGWVREAWALVLPSAHLEDPLGEEGRLGDLVAGGEDPAQVAEEELLKEEVRRALSELGPALRQAVELRIMEALPLEDVARALALPPEEVEARVGLALLELRGRLGAWA